MEATGGDGDSTGTTEEPRGLLPQHQQSIVLGTARGLREKREDPRILTRLFGNLKDLKITIDEEHIGAEIILGIVLALKRYPKNRPLAEQACQALCNLGRYKSCWDAIIKYGVIEQVQCCVDHIAGSVALSTKLLILFRDYWDPIEQEVEAVFRLTTVLMECNRCCENILVLGIEIFKNSHIISDGGDVLPDSLPASSRQAVFAAMREFGSQPSILKNGCELLCSALLKGEDLLEIQAELTKMGLCTLSASNKTCRLSSLVPSLLTAIRDWKFVDTQLLILKNYPHLEYVCLVVLFNLISLEVVNAKYFVGLAQETEIVPVSIAAITRNPQSLLVRLGVCSLMRRLVCFMKEDAIDTDSTKILVDSFVTLICNSRLALSACNAMNVLALHLRGVKSLLLGHAKQIISAASALFENSELASDKSAKSAIAILCHLDLRASVVQQRLMDAHIIMHVCGAMKRFPSDPVVQACGCKILRCFVRSCHCVHRDQGIFTLSRNGAKDVAKAAMANHPGDKGIVYSGAEIFLRVRDFERGMQRFSHSISGID